MRRRCSIPSSAPAALLFETDARSRMPRGTVGDGIRGRSARRSPGRNPLVDLAQQFGEATGRGKGCAPRSTRRRTRRYPQDRSRPTSAARSSSPPCSTPTSRSTCDAPPTSSASIAPAAGATVRPICRLRWHACSPRKRAGWPSIFFNVCVRALDYCPPVDITFGDFLRAVITSDFDLHPRRQGRAARRLHAGIPRPRASCPTVRRSSPIPPSRGRGAGPAPVAGLDFGDPNGLTTTSRTAATATRSRPTSPTPTSGGARLRLGAARSAIAVLPSCLPYQSRTAACGRTWSWRPCRSATCAFGDEPGLGSFPMRGGATIIISQAALVERGAARAAEESLDGHVRYVIGKHSQARRQRARGAPASYYERLGLVEGNDPIGSRSISR